MGSGCGLWGGLRAALFSDLCAAHVEAVVLGAMSFCTLRTASGMHLLRSVGVSFAAVYGGGLKPDKAWYDTREVAQRDHLHSHPLPPSDPRLLVVVGIAPLIFLQPVLLAFPGTWEALHRDAFLAQFSLEVPISTAMAALALVGAYHTGAALHTSRDLMQQLEERAGETEGLLETAMPPFVARALLSDTPPEMLTRSFDDATIAFVALEDYAAKVRWVAG